MNIEVAQSIQIFRVIFLLILNVFLFLFFSSYKDYILFLVIFNLYTKFETLSFRSCRNSIEELRNDFGLVEIPSKSSGTISVLLKFHRRAPEWFRSCRNSIEELRNGFDLVEIPSKSSETIPTL